MKVLFKLMIFCLLLQGHVFAQDLMKERIWKIASRKKSIFLDKGIFHVTTTQSSGQVDGVRNSYIKSRGYERVVFDFNTNMIPSLYGHISKAGNRIYIDFFNTKLSTTITALKNTKYVQNLDFFAIDENSLSIELTMKEKNSFDIFYLDNPGRLVIDIKK